MPPSLVNLRDLALAELQAYVQAQGGDVPLADEVTRRIFAALHKSPVGRTLTELQPHIVGLSRAMAARLDAGARFPTVEVIDRRASDDGFVKYLFRLEDGNEVEAVRIPLPDAEVARAAKAERRAQGLGGLHPLPTAKFTICVSSQVGCALACGFCATGKLGGRRSLSTAEILAQVRVIADEAPHPVRGVVFMGMGEPFLNYEAVIRAGYILSHPAGFGISAKSVSISTAGVVPAIQRFTEERHPFRLLFSLGAPNSHERRRIMPIEERWPLPSLMDAIRAYADASRQRVTLAYVLIGGVNTLPRHARELGALLAGLKGRLNLIDVIDPSGVFQPPDAEELAAFRAALDRDVGLPVVRRYSGGKDIEAACGNLSASRRGGAALGEEPGQADLPDVSEAAERRPQVPSLPIVS